MKPRVIPLGAARFDLDTRTLSGPRGEVFLQSGMFAVLELLSARPGTIVAHSALHHAIHPERSASDICATVAVKTQVSRLRGLFNVLGCASVQMRAEPGLGYSLVVRDRAVAA